MQTHAHELTQKEIVCLNKVKTLNLQEIKRRPIVCVCVCLTFTLVVA